MFGVYIPSVITMMMTGVLLAACAVGPDFIQPTAPDVSRYTKEPLASRTSSTDVKFGQAQHFVADRDIPADWWRVFRARALNTLVDKSLVTNPTLQSAIAALRAAKENVYAQQGKYFPLVQANFNYHGQREDARHPAQPV
jgi:outer membrane protein TolC